MKTMSKQLIGENLLYVLVWTTMFLVPVMNAQMMSELHLIPETIFIAWRQLMPFFIVFLVHNLVLAPRYLLKRRMWSYIIGDILLVGSMFLIVEGHERQLAEHIFTPDNEDAIATYRRVSFTNLRFYWNFMLGLFMTLANTGIKLIYQSMRDEQRMEVLKRQNLQAEMDYLKYQINPHFFMNTLNNIHALIDIDTESAKHAVIELSKMMRYVLYDSGREQIPLRQDIQFLKNYIELMRIRYTDTVEVRMESPENLSEGVMIPPLLPIVFVENAFKHGVSYNSPSFIDISIKYADGKIVTVVTNSRHAASTGHKAGIGLENARKRLDLIYGERGYTLDIREDETTYTVKLVIPPLHA